LEFSSQHYEKWIYRNTLNRQTAARFCRCVCSCFVINKGDNLEFCDILLICSKIITIIIHQINILCCLHFTHDVTFSYIEYLNGDDKIDNSKVTTVTVCSPMLFGFRTVPYQTINNPTAIVRLISMDGVIVQQCTNAMVRRRMPRSTPTYKSG